MVNLGGDSALAPASFLTICQQFVDPPVRPPGKSQLQHELATQKVKWRLRRIFGLRGIA